MKKKFTSITLAAILTASFAVNSHAGYAINATLKPDITVKIDGISKDFYNAQGQEVFPIVYNGSTYLPLRAIGEVMNKNVNWDSASKTASIGGVRTTQAVNVVPNNMAQVQPINATACPEYKIIIDGVERAFKDAKGNVVYPLNYGGSIYLPIRAIGDIMGKDVDWDSETKTVELGDGDDVTDVDTSNGVSAPVVPVNPQPQPQPTVNVQGGNITVEKAKEIALKHAGKTASQVNFIKTSKDFDDGIWTYDIDFIVNSNGVIYEYDYEISMNGTILSYDHDIEGYTNNVATGAANNTSTAAITADKAKQIALAKVPGATNSNIYEFKLDYDDGIQKYEGKIIYGVMEYEFEIDAKTGNVLKWDTERVDIDD